MTEETRNALTLYYNYELKNGMRSDIVANAYYKDPTLDWLLWLTNDVVDPYYQWNLSEDDFNAYLIKKYGSVEDAIRRIIFYRNNWYDDEQVLTPSFYENHLAKHLKKYYMPFYDQNVKILYWRRREEDWLMETNKIYKLYCNTALLAVNDLIDVEEPTGVTRMGGGEITKISSDAIFIKNIDGAFANNDVIVNNAATITDVNLVYEAITADEAVFWSPVTYYDIENERNTYNRSIRILDSSHLMNATESIRRLLRV